MEPQDNIRLGLRRAINALEDAEAALADLATDHPEGRYPDMLAQVQGTLQALRAEEANQP